MSSEKLARAAAVISRAASVVTFRGAGISAACCEQAFRGPDGLWQQNDVLARLEDPLSVVVFEALEACL